MKRVILSGLLFALATAAMSQYSYRHEFDAKLGNGDDPTSSVAGVAIAPSGDIYWVTFEAGVSKLFRAPGAVAAMDAGTTPTRELVAIESGLPSPVAIEAGRGYNDIEVDASGNVYIVGTGGSNATSILRKLGPAPTHTPQWLFPLDARVQGVAKATTTLVVVTFGGVRIYDDATGALIGSEATGGATFQRSVALNAANNDLYAGRNGNNNDDSVNVWAGTAGPSVDANGNYTQAVTNAIPDIGIGSAFGVATQALDFDPVNSQLVAVDAFNSAAVPGPDTAIGVRVYGVTGAGASVSFSPVQFMDTTPNGAFSGLNGVDYAQIGGNDYVAAAVSRGGIFSIVLYRRGAAAVSDWSIY
jgi:hypothetical protein